jgi:hypothetical protein
MANAVVRDSTVHSSRTILGVPIKTEVASLIAAPSRSLARSTVIMIDKEKNEKFFFGGASVNHDPRIAEATSQYEVVERIFAMPTFHRSRTSFSALEYFSETPCDEVAPEQVLITDKGILGAKSTTAEGQPRGAVGLGLGASLKQAKTHGLFEIVERHLRSSIWYRDIFISQVADESVFSDRYLVRRYCVDGLSIPFCLSAITSKGPDEEIFYVGSAVQETFVSACDKADNEALMMLDNYLAHRDGLANTEQSRQRFLNLSGDGSAAVREYFESRVRGHEHIPDSRSYSEQEIAEALLGLAPNVCYSQLLQRDGLFLVRVFSSGLTWERRERSLNPDWPVPDPYC